MTRLVFLLEEYSMKVLLEGLLPRLFPDLSFLCISHEGKQDLEKSMPRKLRAWREPGVRFIVLRDNDGGDCRALKMRLSNLCLESGRADSLVRIACQELEAWYLGEPDAMAEAFDDDRLRLIGNRAAYRDSDDVQQPSAEIVKLVPNFQKVSGARKMAPKLSISRNKSRSFQLLIKGVEDTAAAFQGSHDPIQ
ncbi:MAG: DUF4276 family protein [Rectinemataceae bacterium]